MREVYRNSLLYKSKVDDAWTINPAVGCTHGCKYPCYAYSSSKFHNKVQNYQDWITPKIVANAKQLLEKEVTKYLPEHYPIQRKVKRIKFVHFSYYTDPFPMKRIDIQELTIALAQILNDRGFSCRFLTKGLYPVNRIEKFLQIKKFSDKAEGNNFGISLVSVNKEFRQRWEPFASDFHERINYLKILHEMGFKTWISMEPYPTPNIIKQDIWSILKQIQFVDRVVFGKWNYNQTIEKFKKWKSYYSEQVSILKEWGEISNTEIEIKEGTPGYREPEEITPCLSQLGLGLEV